ncbi:MICOS complex subunit MIC25 isoform X1 [Ambystoma mexicanum]|uniref:MICOS complex subunit MIC25 isoform X1 n=1 Tax=Ambystoma mexicanum TaxID=8296 RepID=UPI0037E95C17
MGGNSSTGRKVSFGLDDEDRVRVLRGIRLSEDVVNRMKDSQQLTSPSNSGSFTAAPEEKCHTSDAGSDKQSQSHGQMPKESEEDLYKRYEREQVIIQEELARLAKKERDAARENLSSNMLREKNLTNDERKKAAYLDERLSWPCRDSNLRSADLSDITPAELDEWAQQLDLRDAEVKRLDAFHKDQLARIEKKFSVRASGNTNIWDENAEIYKLTSDQFHTAATNAEQRVKPRSYDPVCNDLQSKILTCYQVNGQEVLNCSDLAKQYRRCVTDAQKNGPIDQVKGHAEVQRCHKSRTCFLCHGFTLYASKNETSTTLLVNHG